MGLLYKSLGFGGIISCQFFFGIVYGSYRPLINLSTVLGGILGGDMETLTRKQKTNPTPPNKLLRSKHMQASPLDVIKC